MLRKNYLFLAFSGALQALAKLFRHLFLPLNLPLQAVRRRLQPLAGLLALVQLVLQNGQPPNQLSNLQGQKFVDWPTEPPKLTGWTVGSEPSVLHCVSQGLIGQAPTTGIEHIIPALTNPGSALPSLLLAPSYSNTGLLVFNSIDLGA